MIEVFVAMAILTLSGIMLLKYQLLSLQRVQAASLQSIAINQIQNFLEQLYVLKSASLRQIALLQWNQQNQQLLSNGVGQFNCSKLICRISLQWFYKRNYSVALDG